MPAPEKVHLLNYKAGLQDIAILELDRAFGDVGDVSNLLQYFQDITSFPNNLSGDWLENIKLKNISQKLKE